MSKRKKKQNELEKEVKKLADLIDGGPCYVGIILLAIALKSNGIEPFEFLEDEC